MDTNKQKTQINGFDKLIVKLKTEDARYATLSRAIQIIYWIFIPLFFLITILEYTETKESDQLIGGALFILSFLIFAIFFGNYYKEYKYVDYSLPTIQMLKKAAYRYKPFQLKSLWVLLAIVLMDGGLTFKREFNETVLDVQIYFIGLMVVALIVGLIIWYFKYKPLRDEALKLIAELEGK